MSIRSATLAAPSSEPYVHVLELKRGGMGSVDLVVRDRGAFRRIYARKRMHSHFRDDDGFRAMFLDEARLAGLLRHPNVVSVLDYGEDDDGPYLVMDFVDGLSLYEMLRALDPERAFPIGVCVGIVQQVAEGLRAVHELRSEEGRPLGVVHRDVSPQNILVGFDGLTRVTDFGIARAYGQGSKTATGVLKGKLGYMAPEQLRFERPTQSADLFALGVVLTELVTRQRLYARAEDADSARAILHDPPPDIGEEREDVPDSLVQLAFALLAKEPERRPATARDVADRLAIILDELRAMGESADVGAFLQQGFAAQRAAKQETLRAALDELRERSGAGASAAPPAMNPSSGEATLANADMTDAVLAEVELAKTELAPTELAQAEAGVHVQAARRPRRFAVAGGLFALLVLLAGGVLAARSWSASGQDETPQASIDDGPIARGGASAPPEPAAQPEHVVSSVGTDTTPATDAELLGVAPVDAPEEVEPEGPRPPGRRPGRGPRGRAPRGASTSDSPEVAAAPPEGPLPIWGWE